MTSRIWISNSKTVMECIPIEARAAKININMENLPTVKTLGVSWEAAEDMFTFSYTLPSEPVTNKRLLLKYISKLFDPLGFLSPFVIRAKILFQELWTSGEDWNETLPDKIKQKSDIWFNKLTSIHQCKIPRCLRIKNNDKIIYSILHVLVEASQTAFGTVCYLLHGYEFGGTSSSFVSSKTRFAPLNSISIPRLELMSAVLELKLALSVVEALPCTIKMENVIFWSDSLNTLSWIKNPSRRIKTFVANRVGEIQSHSNSKQWRYVPTGKNPADLSSREVNINNFQKSNLWWTGPDFIQQEESQWPTKVLKDIEDKLILEVKNTYTLMAIKSEENGDDWRLEPTRYSSWRRLTRVLAWVRRFQHNCFKKCLSSGTLSTEEINDAETELVINAQKKTFAEEYNQLINNKGISKTSCLIKLSPRIDENKMLRCDSRIKNAKFLSFDTRYLIVLPRYNHITKLIVKD
ncbi:uncharacterized protein LOC136073844 [Hydra vulgaris]|uniref:uncharacterized protein LOC136073844 n=1 Tax=Hydra vulgaris TaxID=6087 RepID=UPI0032EA6677